MRNTITTAIFSIFVVCTLLMNVPLAFADSSSSVAIVESRDNGITADYFAADLFSDSACTVPLDQIFISGEVKYTSETVSEGTRYAISTVSILAEMYLKISKGYGSGTLSVSAICACTFGHSGSQDVDDADNSVLTIVFDGNNSTAIVTNDDESSTDLSVGVHSMAISATAINAVMDSAPNSLGLSLTFLVTDTSTGSIMFASTKTISASGESEIYDEDTAYSSIEEANTENNDFHAPEGQTPKYEFSEAEATLVGDDQSNPGHTVYSVTIESTSNTHNGIADSNGSANLNVSIPSDVSFCIHIHAPANKGNGSRLKAEITIDGVTKSATFTYNKSSNEFHKFVFKMGDGITIKDYGMSNINDFFNDQSRWLCGTVVNIHIHDIGSLDLPQELQVDIMMWPTSENPNP